MSNTETATLPEPGQAYNLLFENVHANLFLQKLASAGIVPQTQREVEDLFTLAGKLRHTKQASEQHSESRFGQAVSRLDSTLQSSPGYRRTQAEHAQLAIKQAADSLMQDPDIYNAVLSLKLHEAAQLSGEE